MISKPSVEHLHPSLPFRANLSIFFPQEVHIFPSRRSGSLLRSCLIKSPPGCASSARPRGIDGISSHGFFGMPALYPHTRGKTTFYRIGEPLTFVIDKSEGQVSARGGCASGTEPFLRPRQESNPHQCLRRALLYPLSYGGGSSPLYAKRKNPQRTSGVPSYSCLSHAI